MTYNIKVILVFLFFAELNWVESVLKRLIFFAFI